MRTAIILSLLGGLGGLLTLAAMAWRRIDCDPAMRGESERRRIARRLEWAGGGAW